jgi:hypothetical protein
VWKLFVELTKVRPLARYYETKRHPNKASALRRALAIYMNPRWRLTVLWIEGPNGERMRADRRGAERNGVQAATAPR